MNSLKKSIAQTKSLRTMLLALTAMPLLITGCATSVDGGSGQSPIVPGAGLHGTVFGGQQAISGATINLYAAGTTSYASANTNLLTSGRTTASDGTFNISSDYTCTAGQQMYIVAIGGNPGSGTNNNSVIVAALGDCSTLSSSTGIIMNEVTTVAAAYALAPFATGYANVGTSAANVNGLKRAFANAAKLANFTNGTASGTLPSGATAPTAEIYSLANTLAACVNSTTAGTPCSNLFTYTTPSGGSAPTDTFGAALNIARNPASNVTSLYNLGTSTPPFASALGSAPSDWSVSIVYTGGSFNSPSTTTVDANGQIWVANSSNNSLSVLAQTGTPITNSPFSGNGLNNPVAIAIDSNGNAVVANKGGGTLSEFNNSGSAITSGSVGSGPVALAFDAPGNLWVANSTGNSISEVSSGVVVQTITLGGSPNAIAINPK